MIGLLAGIEMAEMVRLSYHYNTGTDSINQLYWHFCYT
jgi:hypothetical protein